MGIVGAPVFGTRVVFVNNDCAVVLYNHGSLRRSAIVTMYFFNNRG
jgi:hypothetical protein